MKVQRKRLFLDDVGMDCVFAVGIIAILLLLDEKRIYTPLKSQNNNKKKKRFMKHRKYLLLWR